MRNKKHTRTASKYGMRREVVFVTSIESMTLECERDLIAKMKTFKHEHSFGCNFTRGGEGTSGHKQTAEARQKMSAWRMGRPGHKHTDATRLKMSLSKKGRSPNNKGKCMSELTRVRMSLARKGKPKSEAWKLMMSERMKGNTNGKKKDNVASA